MAYHFSKMALKIYIYIFTSSMDPIVYVVNYAYMLASMYGIFTYIWLVIMVKVASPMDAVGSFVAASLLESSMNYENALCTYSNMFGR